MTRIYTYEEIETNFKILSTVGDMVNGFILAECPYEYATIHDFNISYIRYSLFQRIGNNTFITIMQSNNYKNVTQFRVQ